MADGGDAGPDMNDLDLGPPGRPNFVSLTPSITLPPFHCGSAPPAVQHVDIQNMGDGPGTIEIIEVRGIADYGDIAWLGVHPTSQVIEPGATVQIEVSYVPSGQAPGAYSATILVKAAEADGVAPVSISASVMGSALEISGGTADFGDVAIGSRSDANATFQVANVGNAGTIAVEFSSSASTAFVLGGASFSPAFTLAPGEIRWMSMYFEPDAEGRDLAWFRASTTSVLCVPFEGSDTLNVQGRGVAGFLSLSTGEIDFGRTPCGDQAPAQTLTLTNTGPVPVNFSAALVGGTSRYALSAAVGVVPAMDSTTLTITPHPASSSATSLPAELDDVLMITTNIPGDSPRSVALTQLLGGSLVRFDSSARRFLTALNGSVTQVVTVRNDGPDDAYVAPYLFYGSGSPFTFEPAGTLVVPARGSADLQVRFQPTAVLRYQNSLYLAPASAEGVCNPTSVASTPLGLFGEVNGALAFSTDTLVLRAACGTTPNAVLEVSNPTQSIETGHMAFETSSTYQARDWTSSVITSFQVPGRSSTLINVRRSSAFPVDGTVGLLDSETATLTFDSGPTHAVTLIPEIVGALLEAEATSVGPIEVPYHTWTRLRGRVLNRGNLPYTVVANLPNGEARAVTVPAATEVGPGVAHIEFDHYVAEVGAQTVAPRITFEEVNGVSLSTRCSPLPEPIRFQLVGLAGDLQVSTFPIELGDLRCGSSEVPAAAVRLTNAGAASMQVSATLPLASAFELDLSPGAHTLAPGQSLLVVVRGAPLGNNATPGYVAESLTIRSDVPGDHDRIVPLGMTIRGFRVDLPTSVTLPNTPPFSLSYRSLGAGFSGNSPVALSFDTSASDPDAEFVVGTNPYAQPYDAPVPPVAVFVPRSTGDRVVTAVPSAPPGAPLCNPAGLHPVTLYASSTARSLRVSPGPLLYGEVLCGEQPPARELTLTNLTDATIAFTITNPITADGRFFISPPSGTLAARGSTTVTVSPNTTWPMSPTWLDEGRLVTGETYRDTIEVRVGLETYTSEIIVSTSGAAYLLMPELVARDASTSFAISHFVSTTRFDSQGDFGLGAAPYGSCSFPLLGAPVCGPSNGMMVYTPTSSLSAGRCTPSLAPVVLNYP